MAFRNATAAASVDLHAQAAAQAAKAQRHARQEAASAIWQEKAGLYASGARSGSKPLEQPQSQPDVRKKIKRITVRGTWSEPDHILRVEVLGRGRNNWLRKNDDSP